MSNHFKHKMGIGTVLGVFGGIGIVLGPVLGLSHLEEPWSFVTGFAVGLVCGLGVVLSIFGLFERASLKR